MNPSDEAKLADFRKRYGLPPRPPGYGAGAPPNPWVPASQPRRAAPVQDCTLGHDGCTDCAYCDPCQERRRVLAQFGACERISQDLAAVFFHPDRKLAVQVAGEMLSGHLSGGAS